MILTDLDIVCIEEIFEYLELKDLLNVADSNKRLCHASKFVFIRKYARDENLICSDNIKRSLQTLRIYGSLISLLIVQFLEDKAQQYVIDYISEYCHESLNEIRFRVFYNFNGFKNPLKNVKSVILCSGIEFDKNWLLRSFPRMQKLTLRSHCTPCIHSEMIANHFPYLQYFEYQIILARLKRDNNCIEVFKSFLRLNPQLRDLRLECGSKRDIEYLQVIGERERNLESLQLMIHYCWVWDWPNLEKMHLKSVKHFSLMKPNNTRIQGGIPFSFDQLESFELYTKGTLEQFGFYDVFQKNSSIKKFKLISNTQIDYEILAKYLPLLEEMTHSFYGISVDMVFHVITMFKNLKYFCFIRKKKMNHKHLLEVLSDNWSMQFMDNTRFCKYERDKNYIILKRKI